MKKETFIRAVLALLTGFVLTAFLVQGKTLAAVVRIAMYFSVLFVIV